MPPAMEAQSPNHWTTREFPGQLIFEKGAKSIQWGKNNFSNKWYCYDWIFYLQRKNLDAHVNPYTKINSKWIHDLNVKAKTIKLLEENMGVNLHDPEFGNGFSDMTSKAQAAKDKIDKMDFIKINNVH